MLALKSKIYGNHSEAERIKHVDLAFIYQPPPGFKGPTDGIIDNNSIIEPDFPGSEDNNGGRDANSNDPEENEEELSAKERLERVKVLQATLSSSNDPKDPKVRQLGGKKQIKKKMKEMRKDALLDARRDLLKNAPMENPDVINDSNVIFKPLGKQLLNLQCLRCGEYGHGMDDEKCPLFSAISQKTRDAKIQRDDPMAAFFSKPKKKKKKKSKVNKT